MWARLARFYGWTHDEIAKLDLEDFWFYIQSMEVIQAEEMLLNSRTASVPHMKEKHRERFIKDGQKMATPKFEDGKSLTLQDLVRITNG